jgi:hypothetical protein
MKSKSTKPSGSSLASTKTANPSAHLLNQYFLAATAAGVSVLALAEPAAAEVVYTPVHVVLRANSTYYLDLNDDGIVDVTLYNIRTGSFAGVSAIEAVGNSILGNPGTSSSYCYAFALQKGAKINGSPFVCEFRSGIMAAATQRGRVYGYWVNTQNRYLGVIFRIDHETHYGWARLSVQVSGLNITETLTGYAYETVVNMPINAGRKSGPDDAAALNDSGLPGAGSEPKATSLGALALGANGISRWRTGE